METIQNDKFPGTFVSKEGIAYKKSKDGLVERNYRKTRRGKKYLVTIVERGEKIRKWVFASFLTKIFYEGLPKKPVAITYIDGDVGNTKLSNLSWTSPKGLITGTKKGMDYSFYSKRDLQGFGLDPSSVYKCLKGTRKSHKGFTFRQDY